MYPTDPSISSYGSNPSTPVNSPPPLSSQSSATPHTIHQVGNGSGPNNWQQLTPVPVGTNQPVITSIQSPLYQSELVTRGLHMVSNLITNNFIV